MRQIIFNLFNITILIVNIIRSQEQQIFSGIPKAEIGIAHLSSDEIPLTQAFLFDGDYNTTAISQNYTLLDNKPENFWIILVLKHVTRIKMIRILNRVDCCRDRLIGFKVIIREEEVGSSKAITCGTIEEESLEYEFACEGVGYRVSLRNSNPIEWVNLAEVEVYGERGK